MTTKSVYVSYSWTAERETPLVDELGHVCTTHGLDFRRDNNRLQHGDLIRAFMDELSSHGDIIIVFSRPYFESEYCMYELLQIWINGDFKKRIHLVNLDGISLNDVEFQFKILDYWEKKTKSLQNEIVKRDPASIIPILEKNTVFAKIYRNINELMVFLADVVVTPLYDLRRQQFKPLFERIMPSLLVEKPGYFEANNNPDKSKMGKIAEIDAENLEINTRLDYFSDEMVKLKSTYDKENNEIIEWLSRYNDAHVEKIYASIIKKYGELTVDGGNFATIDEVKDFKLHISLFIDRLETCVFNKSPRVLDEPHINDSFDPNFYKIALLFLFERVPSRISENSKKQLKYCIDHLIERIQPN